MFSRNTISHLPFMSPAFAADNEGDGWGSSLADFIDAMPDNTELPEEDEEALDNNAAQGDNSNEGETPSPDQTPDNDPAREGEQAKEGEDGKSQTGTIDPPVMWTDEAKEAFASAPPELKQYIVEREQQQQAEITRRQMEAADLRKSNEAIGQLATSLTELTQNNTDLFNAKWSGVTQADWDNLAYTNPVQHKALRAEFDAERNALAQIKEQRDTAEAQNKKQWVANETTALLTAHPELGNKDNMQGLVKFAKEQGLTNEELDGLNAKGYKLVYALKNVTQELAKLKAIANPKQVLQQGQQQQQVQTKASIRPSRTTAAASDSSAMKQFKASPTRDNLANLL